MHGGPVAVPILPVVHGGPVAVPVASAAATAVVNVTGRRKGSGVTSATLRGRRRVSGGRVSTRRGGREEGGIESSHIIAAGNENEIISSNFLMLDRAAFKVRIHSYSKSKVNMMISARTCIRRCRMTMKMVQRSRPLKAVAAAGVEAGTRCKCRDDPLRLQNRCWRRVAPPCRSWSGNRTARRSRSRARCGGWARWRSCRSHRRRSGPRHD